MARSKVAKETVSPERAGGPWCWLRHTWLSVCVAAVAVASHFAWHQGRFHNPTSSEQQLPLDGSWKVVSEYPRIYVQDNFLSSEECEFLKAQVSGRLEPAKVVEREENKYDQQVNVRNNQQIWLGYEEERDTPAIYSILKRMHRAARIPDDDAEALQIGHYGVDEKYEMHPDSDPSNDVARPATLIAYLNDVEEGGETLFPLGQRHECTMLWRKDATGKQRFGVQNCCDRQELLRIAAKKGRAVLFFNHDPTGKMDSMAEHAACQVKRGEKWIAQRWFRFNPYQQLVHPWDPGFDGLPLRPSRTDGLRIISQKSPNIYLIEDLLSKEECEALIDLMKKLPGTPDGTDQHGVVKKEKFHVNSSVEKENPILEKISQRFAEAVLMPRATGEQMQLDRYGAGGFQGFHFDNPTDAESNPRVWTIIVYLNGDGSVGESGEGATIFPSGWCRSTLEACCHAGAQHLRQAMVDEEVHWGMPWLIPPLRGRALLFRSLSTSGVHDPAALHGSCASGSEGKMVVQKWYRQRDPQPSVEDVRAH